MHRRPAVWVFLISLASYAYFWHARDWNTASRLMLTYALVDRGTIRLDGLENHTGDIARFQGGFYTDKLPGYSLLAVPPYAAAKAVFGLPDHPLYHKAFTHWPADYWVTLATSGVLTAWAGALLVGLAGDLGCGPRRSMLVGLAYGLATPAYPYATLAFGHQTTAFALLAAFAILFRGPRSHPTPRAALAGFLTAGAAVVELQVGLVAAVLGFYLIGSVVARRWPLGAIGAFAVGAAVPTVVLLGYNQLAFGSPWDMGYFHERLQLFSKVHSARNPLGLSMPDWSVTPRLFWGEFRGLIIYAPITALAPFGWIALTRGRRWGIVAVSSAACAAIFLVNLSYPNWAGGWSAGPRLLVPLLPFATLPVAGLSARGGRGVVGIAVVLAMSGFVVMTLCQGVGARIPDYFPAPLTGVAIPLWRGEPIPPGWVGERFARTIIPTTWTEFAGWRRFVPLVIVQVLAIAALFAALRPRPTQA